MGVKMGWIQIKMGHPLARNGAALAPFRANGAHPSYACLFSLPFLYYYYPARACASKGLCDRSWCLYIISLDFFWNQSFISQNTHFQRSILTQIGFSSNLMASSIA